MDVLDVVNNEIKKYLNLKIIWIQVNWLMQVIDRSKFKTNYLLVL